ncbi:Uncharacterised protein [Serratia quinivorans]|uniref:ATP-binding protein n=1 Tax=Serratia quinivorans TaxID=137545 RepID=UPI00217ABD12|nr:ATP-binding protein [Serratia quinivorans]CAI1870620.1 Uncharacterised protein [Serratia quinivorans]
MEKTKNIGERILIDTGVSPYFLENALTKDVTTLEALFDLVDNSIDAARDDLLKKNCERGHDKLPIDYRGYGVQIRIDNNSVKVFDNCSGIDRETLSKSALYTNKQSQHEYGIGLYGIGLKRSLLKMGTEFSLSVDNGSEAFKSNFNNKSIGGNIENKMYAYSVKSKGVTKSLFSVSNIKEEIKEDLHNSRWFDNAVREFSLRYGIYIGKGFRIFLHHVKNKQRIEIEGVAPSLRLKCEFPPTKEYMRLDGVDVVIETGIHSDYIFPGEADYSLANNRKLTDEFGIYFSCNDRIIVAASTEKAHGWSSKWHSEYNGYVCWVKFISKDASLLPWNTAKTALRTDSSLFLEVRDKLQPIADNYRSIIKLRYGKNKKSPSDKLSINLSASKKDVKSVRNVKTKKSPKPKIRPMEELSRNRDVFVDWDRCTIDIPKYRSKEYLILSELCQLSSYEEPISCVVMLRVFLETTAKQVMKSLNAKWNNSLAKNTGYIAIILHKNGYITDTVKILVERYGRTEEESLLSINNIQSLVHSVDFNIDKTLVNRYWDDLEPFLSGCWNLIKDHDLSSENDL